MSQLATRIVPVYTCYLSVFLVKRTSFSRKFSVHDKFWSYLNENHHGFSKLLETKIKHSIGFSFLYLIPSIFLSLPFFHFSMTYNGLFHIYLYSKVIYENPPWNKRSFKKYARFVGLTYLGSSSVLTHHVINVWKHHASQKKIASFPEHTPSYHVKMLFCMIYLCWVAHALLFFSWTVRSPSWWDVRYHIVPEKQWLMWLGKRPRQRHHTPRLAAAVHIAGCRQEHHVWHQMADETRPL